VNGLVPKNLREEVNKEVAQSARERSQASMQGFQKKHEAPKATVRQEPELPTVIEATAEPVLEKTDEELASEFEAWKAQQIKAVDAN
jgi:ribosomal protein L29